MDWWQWSENLINKLLESAAVNAALLTFLGSANAVGFSAWLVTKLAQLGYTQVLQPGVEALIRLGFLKYDIVTGQFLLKDIQKAKKEGNEKEYWIALSNV